MVSLQMAIDNDDALHVEQIIRSLDQESHQKFWWDMRGDSQFRSAIKRYLEIARKME